MSNDQKYAERLAQEESDRQMAIALSQQQDQNQQPGLPYYAPVAAPPSKLPEYSVSQQQQYQQQQQQYPVIYSPQGLPIVPVYTSNGTAQIVVQRHNLPPRATAQYATDGFPGASTNAIRNPQNHSVEYSVETVPLGEAIATHVYSGGVRVEQPYNTNGFISDRQQEQNQGSQRKKGWWF